MWDYGMAQNSNNQSNNINVTRLREKLDYVTKEALKIDTENEILKLLLRVPYTHIFILYCEKTNKYYQNTFGNDIPDSYIKINVEDLKRSLGV